jgi:hypothetical protein
MIARLSGCCCGVAPGHRQAVMASQQAETIWLVRMFRRIS